MVHEHCKSKKEAEQAAQRLLAEHAKHFSVETSVEARSSASSSGRSKNRPPHLASVIFPLPPQISHLTG
jgi:hypothetical protein